MNEAADDWVLFAGEDLRMAELAYQEGIWNQVAFHAQQCVEKLVKATIANQGIIVPQTHRLVDLMQRVGPAALAVLRPLGPHIAGLDRFYIPTRYPDALPGALPGGLPTEADAVAVLAVAREVTEIVHRLLDGAPRPNPPEAEQAE